MINILILFVLLMVFVLIGYFKMNKITIIMINYIITILFLLSMLFPKMLFEGILFGHAGYILSRPILISLYGFISFISTILLKILKKRNLDEQSVKLINMTIRFMLYIFILSIISVTGMFIFDIGLY